VDKDKHHIFEVSMALYFWISYFLRKKRI